MNDTGATWARHRDELQRVMPEHVARLRWDRATIEDHQRTRLRELLRAAQAGSAFHARRLRGVDPETSELRDRVSAGFGVPVVDQFASTEGVAGMTAPGGNTVALASDVAIVELVDDDNRPVPPGVASAKVLVTNLFNHTQPLIRYELAVVTSGSLDRAALAERLRRAIDEAGFSGPQVTVVEVDAIERHPVTGKAKRFVTLALGGLAGTR